MFRVKPITDPWPIWEYIKGYLQDQNENLTVSGTFMGVFDEERLAGAFLIKPWSEYCYEIHGGVHPDYFGRGRTIIETLGLATFKGTPCLKIIGIVPEFNRLMRNTLLKAGMKQEGVIKKSFLKYMKLHDLYIYGISKMEVPECQRQ